MACRQLMEIGTLIYRDPKVRGGRPKVINRDEIEADFAQEAADASHWSRLAIRFSPELVSHDRQSECPIPNSPELFAEFTCSRNRFAAFRRPGRVPETRDYPSSAVGIRIHGTMKPFGGGLIATQTNLWSPIRMAN